MQINLSQWGPATVLIVVITSIVVAVGGVVVIVNPETLTFDQYLSSLTTMAIAIAGLGIGRGLRLGMQDKALSSATHEDPLSGYVAIDDPEDMQDKSEGVS